MLRGLLRHVHFLRTNIRCQTSLSRHNTSNYSLMTYPLNPTIHNTGLRRFSSSPSDDEKKRALEQFMSKTDASALKRHLINPEKKKRISHGVAKAVLLFEAWTVVFCLSFGIYIVYHMTIHSDQDLLTVVKNTFNQFADTSDRLRANLLEKQRLANADPSTPSSQKVDEKVMQDVENLFSKPVPRDSAARNRFE